MDVLVVGATGRTGRLLARGAIGRGHSVTALVRTPERLGDLADQVHTVVGDALDGGVVSDAVDGRDAVLVVLGAARRKAAPINALGTLNVIRSMQRYGVRRLVVLSCSGVRPGRDPSLPWVHDRIVRRALLGHVFVDLRRMETSVRQSGLDWTIVRPSAFTDQELEGVRHGFGADVSGLRLKISRGQVADFLVAQLAEGDLHRHVSLSA